MTALREQILLLFSTPFYILIIGIEILLSNYRPRKLYGWKDTAANIYLMLLNSAIDLLFRGVYIFKLENINNHQIIYLIQFIL